MDLNSIIEWTSVAFSLLFLALLMRERIECWLFGILSSALSIYLFIVAKLYSEAILYSYYVVIGVYGWVLWNRKKGEELPIHRWGAKQHVLFLVLGAALSLLLGFFFHRYTDAANPFVDATTTIFSFIASYMEAKKILSTWHFWIVLNGVSIWLYYSRGLEVYSGLMVVYFAFSVVGLITWHRRMTVQSAH